VAWTLLKSSSQSNDPRDHPKGGIYGMFMEYMKYTRNFKGMANFAKELGIVGCFSGVIFFRQSKNSFTRRILSKSIYGRCI
jgi:hypothetical protein